MNGPATRRAVVAVAVVLACSQAQGLIHQTLRKPNGMNANNGGFNEFEVLRSTFSKMYPIEVSDSTTAPNLNNPVAPRFCWKFYRPDPEAYHRIAIALRSYHGAVRWILFSSAGKTCIASWNGDLANVGPTTQYERWTAYPVIEHTDAKSSVWIRPSTQYWPNESFIKASVSDIAALSQHIENALQLQNAQPQDFRTDFLKPPPDSALEDFLEPGMQAVWVVTDPDEFARNRQKELARAQLLHFGISEKEWISIRSDLCLDESAQQGSCYDPSNPEMYPLFSRISITESTTYQYSEIEGLKEECNRALALCSTADALRGLNKLLLMCNWSRQSRSGLYFQAP